MIKILALAFLALASFNVSAQEQATPPVTLEPIFDPTFSEAEQEWIDEFYIVKQESIPRGWYGNLTVTRLAAEDDTPAATYFLGGGENRSCLYSLTVYENDFAVKILSYVAPEDRSEVIRLIWAHELGHCAQFYSVPLDAFLFWPASVRKMDNTVEAFADVFALAYAAQHFPEKYDTMVAFMIHLRTTLNTSEYSTPNIWIPAYQKYNTQEFINRSKDIKKLAKHLRPEQVAAKIVYGFELK